MKRVQVDLGRVPSGRVSFKLKSTMDFQVRRTNFAGSSTDLEVHRTYPVAAWR